MVAHEIGHGLLDAIRPDLWSAAFLEVGAFHESFGDCIAILSRTRRSRDACRLLGVTKTLKKRNLAGERDRPAARRHQDLDLEHNAAEPQRAYNALAHRIPSTLPLDGEPPAS